MELGKVVSTPQKICFVRKGRFGSRSRVLGLTNSRIRRRNNKVRCNRVISISELWS
jgi:hypothetical protein